MDINTLLPISPTSILIGSLILTALGLYLLWIHLGLELSPLQYGVIALTALTAEIHILVSGSEIILFLNGMGYLALLTLLYFIPLGPYEAYRPYVRWLLLAYTLVTIALYFVTHPWGMMGIEIDVVGLSSKLVEIALVVLLFTEAWQARREPLTLT